MPRRWAQVRRRDALPPARRRIAGDAGREVLDRWVERLNLGLGERRVPPVKDLDVTFEHRWQLILDGYAQLLLIGDDDRGPSRMIRFAPRPSSAVARVAQDSYASVTSSLSAFEAVIG